MRTLPIPFVAVLLIAATTAAKADLTIIQKTEGTINSGQLTLRIKGDKARTDIAPQITMMSAHCHAK